MKLVLSGRSVAKRREAETVRCTLRQDGLDVNYIQFDISKLDGGCIRLTRRLRREYGRLDGVIHSAGSNTRCIYPEEDGKNQVRDPCFLPK